MILPDKIMKCSVKEAAQRKESYIASFVLYQIKKHLSMGVSSISSCKTKSNKQYYKIFQVASANFSTAGKLYTLPGDEEKTVRSLRRRRRVNRSVSIHTNTYAQKS